MLPKITIIVTCYNQETTLAQALESIISQETSYSFEIIIGDDFSTDQSRQICLLYREKYPQLIKLIFQETNIGVARNWVSCIQKAQGSYIAACAADDYWHFLKKLEYQVAFLELNKEYGLLYTDYDVMEVKKGMTTKNYLKTTKQKIYQGDNLIKNIFSGQVPILPATAIFRKELFLNNVPIEDFCSIFPIEDWPTWVILSKYCKIGYLPFSSATYRRGHESLSNISDYDKTKKRFEEEHKMYQYICRMFPDDLIYNESGYLVYTDTIMLSLAYKKNDYFKAKEYAKKLHLKGFRNNKTTFATNWVLFKIFNLLKSLKQNLWYSDNFSGG
jgi:glycosyltransferase involved in cell wall biosynthesis